MSRSGVSNSGYATKAALRNLIDLFDPLSPTFFNDAFPAPAADDIPTIVVTQTSATTMPVGSQGYNIVREGGVSSAPADMVNDPVHLFDGSPYLSADPSQPTGFVRAPLLPGGTSQAARYVASVAVLTSASASQVEFQIKAKTTTLRYRFIVNGKWLQLALFTQVAVSGGDYRIRLDFPTAAVRTIQFEADDVSFGQTRVTSGATLTRPAPYTKRLAANGDSYTGGAGYAPDGAGRMETAARYIAHLAGYDSYWNFAIGGTGWIAGGSTNFESRMPAILECNPDAILIIGSRNDGASGGSDLQSAVESALNVVGAVPQVYVSGPSTSGFDGNNSSVNAAATAKGRAFIDAVDGGWITSADFWDGVHPNIAGHYKLAAGMYSALRPYLLTDS